MDIKSWKIMLAVDDYGSFTRVGAELGYTQSGITQTMKNLEKNFKNTVWSRQSETFSLTLDYSDTLALYVEAKAEYTNASPLPDIKILTWKTISTGTWTPDTRQPVYNKGETK